MATYWWLTGLLLWGDFAITAGTARSGLESDHPWVAYWIATRDGEPEFRQQRKGEAQTPAKRKIADESYGVAESSVRIPFHRRLAVGVKPAAQEEWPESGNSGEDQETKPKPRSLGLQIHSLNPPRHKAK